MHGHEKRIATRSSFRESLEIEFSAISAREKAGRGRGIDISSGGLGLETAAPLHKGEVVRLLVPLKESGTSMPVLAEVQWVLPMDQHYRAGLRFLA
jgi:hypothetical protein